MIVSVHVLIWESIENNRCYVYGLYGQIFSFYTLICTGIIPTSVMIVFGILLIKALRQLRNRVQPYNNNTAGRLNRRDINLMKIVLVEVIVYIFCTFGYPLTNIYTTITANMYKTAEREQIESFINFILANLLLYLNYNTTFYVHIFTSKTYRREVKQFMFKLIKKTQNTPIGIQIQT
jgi:hypothetical protein